MTNMSPRKRVLIPRNASLAEDKQVERFFSVPGNAERKLRVVGVFGTSLFEIKYTDGGSIPEMLRGRYTKESGAIKAIERFIELRDNGQG
jgi:hypothetical protein